MLRFLNAGESHGPALTAIIEGYPSNVKITTDRINKELARRQKGYGRGGRMKIEKDTVEILSGVRFGITLGSPITLVVRNKDWENWTDIMAIEGDSTNKRQILEPRPGHADLTGGIKYGFYDLRNILERASARETTTRVAVGALCKILLEDIGIKIGSYVLSIGEKKIDKSEIESISYEDRFNNAENSELRLPILGKDEEFKEYIDKAKEDGESLGGIFEVYALNVPVGLGSYSQWDTRLDGKIAQAIMSIQAIKGVEIGEGFNLAYLPGSQAHDEIFYSKERGFYRKTNRAGGLEGGMTNGEPIIVRAAMKPIPTLMRHKSLQSVNVITKEPFDAAKERSDITAVPAAAVVAESMLAFVLAREILEKFGSDNWIQIKERIEKYRQDVLNY
ncbi:MAG TPA: chorismate synthase [Sulfurihydrogenibium sp.]|uniref:Chorismate synthase n=1 Tax=Sulfurihydrogenibium sp. (strain YO3AOP1) TaxID=436114 RepID=AROC_SULSY|nr:chorismate synthase [Sulfurihydrogenibium sp. YO3AOP1]B2V7C0.1 RecName: Full=Chorismate synthase; Short=CS; AltName: Full=5-enolpyruvylshikimate-3-phosphate phospholyase [Sulfurihydrogenibium sp. YO3AOP1]ACD67351.1 Chorismate synthase [Sulfurihydrogenibium sp. YO3AOP1]HBT98087.1 chorismate synthase [Sulfurihydrogenibium sp.]